MGGGVGRDWNEAARVTNCLLSLVSRLHTYVRRMIPSYPCSCVGYVKRGDPPGGVLSTSRLTVCLLIPSYPLTAFFYNRGKNLREEARVRGCVY